MAIGSELNSYGNTPARRAVGRLFGIADLHTHLRLRPLIRHLPQLLPKGPATVLECGCGIGVNLFELVKAKKDITAEGYDLSEASIAHANSVRNEYFPESSVSLHCADVTQLEAARSHYDCVLLMDVLEHVSDDRGLANWVVSAARDGGLIGVSVPTHRYSRIFGEDFHQEVGHVREGYTAEELIALFPGLELVGLWHNTGLVAQLGCWIYYRCLRKLRVPVVGPLLGLGCQLLFAWADFPNGPGASCSIFAIFRKPSGPKSCTQSGSASQAETLASGRPVETVHA